MWARELMNERVTSEERRQSPGEEVANAVSAAVRLIAAIAGTLFYSLSESNGAAIGPLQVRWYSLRRPSGCISHRRSITRCRELRQSGFSGYSTTWESFF